MADDVRRAEIEAVARSMMGVTHGTALRVAERAIAALDRIRDARGNDDLRDWLLRTVGVASSVPSAKRAIERLVADATAESCVRDARGDDEGAMGDDEYGECGVLNPGWQKGVPARLVHCCGCADERCEGIDDRVRDARGECRCYGGLAFKDPMQHSPTCPARDARGDDEGRELVHRLFALERLTPEWEQALADLRAWSMSDWNPPRSPQDEDHDT